jgi:hypothetical protein
MRRRELMFGGRKSAQARSAARRKVVFECGAFAAPPIRRNSSPQMTAEAAGPRLIAAPSGDGAAAFGPRIVDYRRIVGPKVLSGTLDVLLICGAGAPGGYVRMAAWCR